MSRSIFWANLHVGLRTLSPVFSGDSEDPDVVNRAASLCRSDFVAHFAAEHFKLKAEDAAAQLCSPLRLRAADSSKHSCGRPRWCPFCHAKRAASLYHAVSQTKRPLVLVTELDVGRFDKASGSIGDRLLSFKERITSALPANEGCVCAWVPYLSWRKVTDAAVRYPNPEGLVGMALVGIAAVPRGCTEADVARASYPNARMTLWPKSSLEFAHAFADAFVYDRSLLDWSTFPAKELAVFWSAIHGSPQMYKSGVFTDLTASASTHISWKDTVLAAEDSPATKRVSTALARSLSGEVPSSTNKANRFESSLEARITALEHRVRCLELQDSSVTGRR